MRFGLVMFFPLAPRLDHFVDGLGPLGVLEAVTYATNQWPTLGVYLTDGRLTIDNSPAEQALRPLAIGRRNWLHVAGDGGLKPTAVLLSVTASGKRHDINPWVYLTHVLTELPGGGRRAGAFGPRGLRRQVTGTVPVAA